MENSGWRVAASGGRWRGSLLKGKPETGWLAGGINNRIILPGFRSPLVAVPLLALALALALNGLFPPPSSAKVSPVLGLTANR